MKPGILLTLLLTLVAGSGLAAQCFGDDGLDTGKCWDRVTARLPAFPTMHSSALWIGFKECTPTVRQATLTLPAPVPAASGVYLWVGVDLRDAANMPLWDRSTRWFLFYSRTWLETLTLGSTVERFQVWRFLINADVRPSPEVRKKYPVHQPGNDVIVPPCVYKGTPQPVHFFGYVDYAVNCRTGKRSIAFGATHLCDAFMHHEISPFPAGGHPGWSYAVVAPATFTPSTKLSGVEGIARSEDFRMYRFANLPFCESEQPVSNGLVSTRGRRCACGSRTAAGQFVDYSLQALTACNSSARSITPFPLLWGGPGQMSVGTFNVADVYPGKESLYFVVDPMVYHDGRTNLTSVHAFVGVATAGGWKPTLFHPGNMSSPIKAFLDLQNILLLPTYRLGIGGQFISDKILNLNTY